MQVDGFITGGGLISERGAYTWGVISGGLISGGL